MEFAKYEEALSAPRLGRYLRACGGNKRKALALYRCNIKLSQRLFGVIGVFEVMLRTAINEHFKSVLNDPDWIISQARDGFMKKYDTAILKEQAKLVRDGNYTNDRILSSLSFGVWAFLFSRTSYRESGKTLLKVFPNKAHGMNQSAIFKELDSVRMMRNRIAHFEPICFNRQGLVDASIAVDIYDRIKVLISYLGYDPDEMLRGVENPAAVAERIDRLLP